MRETFGLWLIWHYGLFESYPSTATSTRLNRPMNRCLKHSAVSDFGQLSIPPLHVTHVPGLPVPFHLIIVPQ